MRDDARSGPLRWSTMEQDAIDCPKCGFHSTHVDRVEIAAREEDQTPTPIAVDAVAGTISVRGPLPPTGGLPTRRHWIVLRGRCEQGCDFAVTFVQHKGSTLVKVIDAATNGALDER